MKILSVVIPVYYNETSLIPLYDKLVIIEKELLNRQIKLELIFVDDGSKDQSWLRLKEIKNKRKIDTKLIKLTRNFGSYNAIKTGLDFVTGDCFCYLSADLQDPPELLLQAIDKWLDGAKYVICERNTRSDPKLTILYARIYYKLIRLFVMPSYPKGGFDLALMDRIMIPYLQNCGKNINLHLFGYYLGFTPTILHYHRAERHHGKSRWTFIKRLNLFLDSILGFSRIFIRLISTIGVLVSLIGFFYGGFIIFDALCFGAIVRGFPTIVALLVFFSGLLIVMLGVIAEYIWRIYDQITPTPRTVISEIVA